MKHVFIHLFFNTSSRNIHIWGVVNNHKLTGSAQKVSNYHCATMQQLNILATSHSLSASPDPSYPSTIASSAVPVYFTGKHFLCAEGGVQCVIWSMFIPHLYKGATHVVKSCVLPPAQAIHSVGWHHEGKQFMCSHSDGSLTMWNLRNTTKPFQVTFPHGESKKKETSLAISK